MVGNKGETEGNAKAGMNLLSFKNCRQFFECINQLSTFIHYFLFNF